MLHVETVPVTEFSQNARVLWCSDTKEGVVVDPGGEPKKIEQLVTKLGISVKGIWLTHSHLDHCGGVAPLLKVYNVPLLAHPAEKMMRANVQAIAQMYGMAPTEWHNCPEPTVEVTGGETVTIGKCEAKVLFTPGHSVGSVSFYFAKDELVVSGDALFAGSIGRTDLPGGDTKTLLNAIKTQLFTLPPKTRVLSGHGVDTTIGEEVRSNPFFNGAAYE